MHPYLDTARLKINKVITAYSHATIMWISLSVNLVVRVMQFEVGSQDRELVMATIARCTAA